MKKLTTLSVLLFGIMAVSATLTSCSCEHEWKDATCATPKTCTLCEENEGEALGHKFEAATCTLPEICTVCEAENGELLGHTTVIDEAVEPTCSTEGLTEGEHCTVCGEIIIYQNIVDTSEHTAGDWNIVKEATFNELGEKQVYCIECNEILLTEPVYYYDITEDEKKFYINVLDTYNSIKTIHLNPASFKLLGAVVSKSVWRTTIHLSYEGTNGKTYTDYIWKNIGITKTMIKNIFGIDNYTGAGSPVEILDLDEILYFEKCGDYTPTISPLEDIIIEY